MAARKQKLKPIAVGELSVGDSVRAHQSLNLAPVLGIVRKVDAPIVDNYGRRWQGVLVEFADGGAWFHLCERLDVGVYAVK